MAHNTIASSTFEVAIASDFLVRLRQPAEFLGTFSQMYGFERARAARLPQEMMELFDLTALSDRWLSELQPAERARLSLARALLSDPEMLLLDRPFDRLEQRDPDPASDAAQEQEASEEEQARRARESAPEVQQAAVVLCAEVRREPAVRLAVCSDGGADEASQKAVAGIAIDVERPDGAKRGDRRRLAHRRRALAQAAAQLLLRRDRRRRGCAGGTRRWARRCRQRAAAGRGVVRQQRRRHDVARRSRARAAAERRRGCRVE